MTNGLLFSSIFIKLKLSLSVCFFLKPRGDGSATLTFNRRGSGIFRNLSESWLDSEIPELILVIPTYQIRDYTSCDS